ncbi:MAG: 50S ribosomal protein L28 [Deinococcota bacterium]|jgi:large subunit ribosomal protein L28|nr:50S ribosomal protein L28 [Deinococcota bacterium]
MAKVCEICGKKPIVLNNVVRSGKAKREGGVGKNTTGISKKWKLPNLQKVSIQQGSNRKSMRVCTSCIRGGKTLSA